jgi:hypothetical protein
VVNGRGSAIVRGRRVLRGQPIETKFSQTGTLTFRAKPLRSANRAACGPPG